MNVWKPAAIATATLILAGCGDGQDTSARAPSSTAPAEVLKPVAGVQDIMAHLIDPAADFLWESVSTTVTATEVTEKQPRTDAEWNEVRRQAVILTEGANLLLMDGRHVAREGRQLEDHGTPGNLTAEESERAIAMDRATYVSFVQALREVGTSMLHAADDKNPQGIVDAGEQLDQVCEGCHLKFWYPGQQIPAFPDQAPEIK